MFHSSLCTHAKNPFYYAQTASNSAPNHRFVVAFVSLWANAAPTWNTIFSYFNFDAQLQTRCLLISLGCQLSLATLLFDPIQWFSGFFCVFGHSHLSWTTRALRAPLRLTNDQNLIYTHWMCNRASKFGIVATMWPLTSIEGALDRQGIDADINYWRGARATYQIHPPYLAKMMPVNEKSKPLS